MKVHLDVPFSIVLEAPLHVGSGQGRGLVRRAFVRDGGGRPYIPGSSLKGRARSACEALVSELLPGVCGVPRVAQTREKPRHVHERCIVCRTFGAIGGNEPDGRGLRWEDAQAFIGVAALRADDSARAASAFRWAVIERTQVQLSRARGIAAEERLFSAEVVASYVQFRGRVTGWIDATPTGGGPTQYYEVALLLAGLRLVDGIGGMRRRGAGACQITPDEIGVRGEGDTEIRHSSLDELLRPLDLIDRFPGAVR